MNPYLFMTLIGVSAKLWAFIYLRRRWQPRYLHKLLLGLVLVLLAQSTCELMLYAFAHDPGSTHTYWSLVGYYLFTFGTITILPYVALEVVEGRVNPYLAVIAVTAVATTTTMLLFSRLIIADAVPVHYSLTRVPGPYYWVFQVSALMAVLYTIVTLVTACRSQDIFIRAKATNLLLAFLPVFTFAVCIVVLMQMGYKINAVGILPLCMVIYVAALLQHLEDNSIPDYTLLIPWSKKARLVRRLTRHIRQVHREGLKEDTKNEYQHLLTQYALEIHDGNQTKAARWLKVSQSWVSRRQKS